MKTRQYFLYTWLLCLWLLVSYSTVAQIPTIQTNYLNKTDILAGTGIALSDPFTSGSGLATGSYTTERTVNIILDYTRRHQSDVSDGTEWTYTVGYELYDKDHHESYRGQLTIDFTSGSATNTYTDRKQYLLSSDEYYLSILFVEATDGSGVTAVSELPNDILLTIENESQRYHSLDPTESLRMVWDNTTYQVSWNAITGADYYDLEWVFIDSLDVPPSGISSSIDAFSYQSSVRIRTPHNYHHIEPIFPKGKVYYRVRAVGYFTSATTTNKNTAVKEGYWNYNDLNGNNFILTIADNSPAQYQQLVPFEKSHNWTYERNFIEGGKSKAIVSYFDGSLRSRQVNTRISSENTILTAEQYYDREGRSAISIVPSPNLSATTLNYNAQYNRTHGGGLIQPSDYEGVNTFRLDEGHGNAVYYSPNNPYTGDEKNYIPDADGYVFTQTTYERDGRSRPVKQSGLGSAFRMGSGRESITVVETATDRELRELFGSNVGEAEHYRKITSFDPNHQQTVVFQDLSGKTVATGLVGKRPENLLPIDGLETVSKTHNIGKMTPYHLIDGKVIKTTALSNWDTSNIYRFNYEQFYGDMLYYSFYDSMPDPDLSVDVCTHCQYNVKLWIIAPDGEQVALALDSAGIAGNELSLTVPSLDQQMDSTHILNAIGNQLTATCTGGTEGVFSVSGIESFTASFDQFGKYYIHKEISIDTSHIEKVWTDSILPHLDTIYNALLQQQLDSIDYTGCDDWCEAHPVECDSLLNSYGSISTWDSNGYGASTCEAYYQQLLQDVGVVNGVAGNQFLDADFRTKVVDHYTTNSSLISTHFPNGEGHPYTIDSIGVLSNWTDIDNAPYLDTWRQNLVVFHREYCLYQDCIDPQSIAANNQFLSVRQSISSWSESNSTTTLITYREPISACNIPGIIPACNGGGITRAWRDDTLLTTAEETTIRFAMTHFAKVSATNVISLYEYLSESHQSTAGGWSGLTHLTNPASIYYNLTQQEADERQWEFFVNYYYDIRSRVTRTNALLGCDTTRINFGILNNTHENCIFHAVPKIPASLTSGSPLHWFDYSTVYSDPTSMLSSFTDPTYASGMFDSIDINAPNRFGCDTICKYNVKHWMDELSFYCPDLSSYPSLQNNIATLLGNFCYQECSSTTNPTASITGAIVQQAAQGKGALAQVFQKLDSAGVLSCADSLVHLIAPVWGSTNTYPCNTIPADHLALRDILNYMAIHHPPPFPPTISYFPEIVNYPVNTTPIYSHFGAVIDTSVTDSLHYHAKLRLGIGQEHALIIYWDRKDGCETGGVTDLQHAHYMHLDTLSTDSCYTQYDGGCIAWALYDSLGNGVPYSTGTNGSNWGNISSDSTIASIEYVEHFTGTFPSDTAIKQLSQLQNLVNTHPENFVYKKMKITFSNGVEAYVFGDKDCLSPMQSCIQPFDSCKAILQHIARDNADALFEAYVNDEKGKFYNHYLNSCDRNIKDIITYQDSIEQGYYTLYYYDQAGNLVQTVPPSGVDVVDETHFPKGIWDETEPQHTLMTTYQYNSMGQLVHQNTPDGGTTRFFYNKKGQLRLSQNAEQLTQSAVQSGHTYTAYSYSEYDALGRAKQAGQLYGSLQEISTGNYVALHEISRVHRKALLHASNLTTIGTTVSISGAYQWRVYSKEQMISTYYGDETTTPPTANFAQENTKSRVVATTFKHNAVTTSPTTTDYDAASFYSYDELGNVKTLVQENRLLSKYGNDQQYKRVDYMYDLISGNVKEVAYQNGQSDQYFHRYSYDADNRIEYVKTSSDGIHWDKDARYEYYLHGVLQRIELGEDKVQGQDMLYTLQGWLKGNNSTLLDHEKDMAGDAQLQALHQHRWTAKDAYAFTLGYYHNDYKGIGQTNGVIATPKSTFTDASHALYNGNIAWMTTAMLDLDEERSVPLVANSYRYDQLQRFKSSTDYEGDALYTSANNSWMTLQASQKNYVANVSYDLNGNITALKRYADDNGTGVVMDQLNYHYVDPIQNNRLAYVTDSVTTTQFTDDLESQSSGNYDYDNIGNLIKDDEAHITDIKWTVTGKVKEIIKEKDVNQLREDLEFVYDASGNRVAKIVKPHVVNGSIAEVATMDQWTTTYYTRDASGNVMATYKETVGSISDLHHKPYVAFEVLAHSGTIRLDAIGTGYNTSIINHSVSANTPEQAAAEIVTEISNFPFSAIAEGNLVKVYHGASVVYQQTLTLSDQNNGLLINIIQDTFKVGQQPTTSMAYQNLSLQEQHIYGSSRLGLKQSGNTIASVYYTPNTDGSVSTIGGTYQDTRYSSPLSNAYSRVVANKRFELSNHLGNVLSVINDKKLLKTVTIPMAQPSTGFYAGFQLSRIDDDGGWRSITENAGVSLQPNETYQVLLKDSLDAVQNGLFLTTGKLLTLDIDVTNTNVADLYLIVQEEGEGYLKEQAITASGTYTFHYIANAELVYVTLQKRGATTAQAQEASINNITVTESYEYMEELDVNLDIQNATTSITPISNGTYSVIGNEIEVNTSTLVDGIELSLGVTPQVVNRLTFNLSESSDAANITVVDGSGAILDSRLDVEAGSELSFNFTPSSTTAYVKVFPTRTEAKLFLSNIAVVRQNVVKQYFADVLSYSDYYPFGMLIPNRHANASEYRYGYQGSEKDNEIKGLGNSYTTLYRQLDPRIGRWLSIDPQAASYPSSSPYVSMGNVPTTINDPNGDVLPVVGGVYAVEAIVAYFALGTAATVYVIANKDLINEMALNATYEIHFMIANTPAFSGGVETFPSIDNMNDWSIESFPSVYVSAVDALEGYTIEVPSILRDESFDLAPNFDLNEVFDATLFTQATVLFIQSGAAKDILEEYNVRTVDEHPELHGIFVQALKELSEVSGSVYSQYLYNMENGISMTNKELERTWNSVRRKFKTLAEAQGIVIGSDAMHHVMFNKEAYPLGVLNPTNLTLPIGKTLHELLHRTMTGSSNIWKGPINPAYEVPVNYTPLPSLYHTTSTP